MNEHPLVRSVGVVLRARDPRGARVLLAALEQWLSEPRTGRPDLFGCWMCMRRSRDVAVFTHVVPEANGELTWDTGWRFSDARISVCDVCVGGCRAALDPSGEEALLGHLLAALKRSDEEDLGGKVAAAYARPRLWIQRGLGRCVACQNVHPRIGTEELALCEQCLGRFQLPPLRPHSKS